MSKRANSQEHDAADSRSSGVSSPVNKKPRLVAFEPIRLPTISTVTDLERHTLVFQNRKLAERLEQKKKVERDLRKRIEKLEQRQNRDDVFLCVVNRHWARLDEDVQILLQRFDSETEIANDTESPTETSASFLTQLSQWDREELDNELTQRVEFSKRSVAKLIRAFDKLVRRNQKFATLINDRQKEMSSNNTDKSSATDSDLLVENVTLRQDNDRLQKLTAKLQEKNHSLSSKHSLMKDQLSAAETKSDECRAEFEEVEFELEKTQGYADKIALELKEMHNKLQHLEQNQIVANGSNQNIQKTEGAEPISEAAQVVHVEIDRSKIDELTISLEEQKELAANRLNQLQELTEKNIKAHQTIEHLRSELSLTPEHIIVNSSSYCRLQSQFSVLYNESTQTRLQLEEVRNQQISTKVAHLKQIEQMESEELLAQKQLRAEMVQLEDQLSQVRREYEMLRVEFEQTLAANEQSGPLNKEMRQLLASYKVQNVQFRNEVQRFKRKWKDAVSTIAKVQKELDTEKKAHENCIIIPLTGECEQNDPEYYQKVLLDLERCVDIQKNANDNTTLVEKDERLMKMQPEDLRRLVKHKEKKLKELEESFQTLKQSTMDEEAKAEILKTLKTENAKLRHYICIIGKKRGKDGMPIVDEPTRHIKKLEEQVEKLKKEILGCKQEEETLLNEMEVTGQAFEEMQEQSVRLVQQRKEKDDANFKLMSDRIKTNQQQKLLREEKDLLQEQVSALHNQVEAQHLVTRKLEEKENLLQQQLSTVEKEMASRQQALELHKRKAIEGAQSLADLKLQVDKLSAQLFEAQQNIATKTASVEETMFRIDRLQEEIQSQKKRLERAKKLEKAGGATDEVLLEEIRELKEHLTCPSCKVRRKDGVLTKCYHVFCMDCLKTRYDTRQRKCPKCNAAFGANDFKRIYIG